MKKEEKKREGKNPCLLMLSFPLLPPLFFSFFFWKPIRPTNIGTAVVFTMDDMLFQKRFVIIRELYIFILRLRFVCLVFEGVEGIVNERLKHLCIL